MLGFFIIRDPYLFIKGIIIMSLFENLTTNGLKQQQDRVGGTGFSVLDSGLYNATIKAAYAHTAASGAKAIVVIATLTGSNLTEPREYRETFYVTNKLGNNWYLNSNNERVGLKGFNIVNNLCLVSSGKSLAEQPTEDKVLNLYDAKAGKEIPQSVPVLSALTGREFIAGIIKEIHFKQAKNQSTGAYEDTDETREVNAIENVFNSKTRCTANEIIVGGTSGEYKADFIETWDKANTGKVFDRTKKKGKKASSTGSNTTNASAPADSSFDKLFS